MSNGPQNLLLRNRLYPLSIRQQLFRACSRSKAVAIDRQRSAVAGVTSSDHGHEQAASASSSRASSPRRSDPSRVIVQVPEGETQRCALFLNETGSRSYNEPFVQTSSFRTRRCLHPRSRH